MKRRKSDLITVSEVSEKFRNCGLFVMAERLEEMDRDGSLMSMTPLEAVDQLISSHELSLQNRISERYRKQSKLYIPMANLADIIYKPDRHINTALVDRLATNEYIDRGYNVIISSASGCGKTFFACAFGNKACEHQYSVRYYTMTEFLDACHIAKDKDKYLKFRKKLSNTNLIILDDFLLTSISLEEAEFLFQLFSERTKQDHRSFIICSQLTKKGMYEKLQALSPSLADAIVNRLGSSAYDFGIEGRSMRELDIQAELEKQREAQSRQ